MNFAAFIALRDRLRRERPELIDRSELNVYRSLRPRLPELTPSTNPEARYRCHLAERFLAHLGLDPSWKARTHVSHGVRRSLRALFGVFASERLRVGVPSDVYPTYLELASQAGLEPVTFEQRSQVLPLEHVDVVLVCEPAKPWGTRLEYTLRAKLRAWEGLTVIDSAYSTPPTGAAIELLEAGKAIVLSSLSKGWLIPDHGGVCLVPQHWVERTRPAFAALEKDEERLRIAYAALTTHADRPTRVGELLARRAELLDASTSADPRLAVSPCHGYFAVSERSFHELLDLGVLAVPSSVFGASSFRGSILSSLEPATSFE